MVIIVIHEWWPFEVAIAPAVYSCPVSELGVNCKVRPGLGVWVRVCFLSDCQRSKTSRQEDPVMDKGLLIMSKRGGGAFVHGGWAVSLFLCMF